MRRVSVALAVACFALTLCVAATNAEQLQELPAAELVTTQMEKVTKIITLDEKACEGQINELQLEINKRQLKITKYEKQISTVRTTFELSQKQLRQELSAIQEVKQLVQSIVAGASVSSSSADAANAKINSLDQQASSVKMAGVLRNIVTSVTNANSGVTVNLDMSEVIKLITELETNIQTALKVDSVTQEEKNYSEHISVEKAAIEDLQQKLTKAQGECSRRRSEFTQVLAVLKLIEQKYQNVTVPNCKPALEEKNKETSQCVAEKEILTKRAESAEAALATCQKNAASSSSSSSSAECSSATTKIIEQSKTIEKCQADNIQSREQVETLQKQVVSVVSEKTAVEAKLAEARQELSKVSEKSKCTEERAQNQQLETRIHELSIKAELGEKCAANYKAQQTEKSEMLKQLEKMTVLNKQLDSCQFEAAKTAKQCAAEKQESSHAQTKVVEQMSEETKRLNQEISRLQEEAKCSSERSVIEKYEKEIVTVKSETRTVVTQVESDVRGCHAELATYKTLRAKDEQKLNEFYSKVSTLEQQLKIVKEDHASCVDSHSKTQTACKAVTTELAKCQSDIKAQTEQLTAEHSILRKLQGEKQALAAEVRKLEVEEKSLKTEVSSLTTKITTSEKRVVTLQSELEAHETAEKHLAEEKTRIETTLETKVHQITTVEHKIETLESSLKGEQAGNHKLLAELRQLHSERESLQTAKITAEASLQKAQIKIANLKDFKAAAIKHLEDARDVITESDKRIDELTAKISESVSRRSSLLHHLSACDSQLESTDKAVASLKAELAQCQAHAADQDVKLHEAEDAAQCIAHKATITELKKHGYTLRVELRTAESLKEQLVRKVSSLEAKLEAWEQLNHKLQVELRQCADGHAGCRSSVRSLKNQMLSNLRRIKSHVASVAQLEEQLAASQVELSHTRKQWSSDRAAYKAFKDNLLVQMAKLISLAKDAKRKFDVARAAAKNELKVQDAQWGVCRKEVLNYERILGSGVVRAEKEKMKAYLATKRYVAVKSSSEAALHKAQQQSGATSESREANKAQQSTHEKMEQLRKNAASSSN